MELEKEIAIIVISSIASGILGVLISISYHRKSDQKRTKMDVLRNLAGNRHNSNGDDFTKALNEIFVVFNKSKKIQTLVNDLHTKISLKQEHVDTKLYELFIALCKDLKINTSAYNESSFMNVFNIRKQ